MALQASGTPLKFSEISAEFGLPPGRNLGAYRVSENIGSLLNMPLDSGIPQSGTIRFSDFYSKRLNVVVDCHSGGDETRLNGRTRYINNNVRVIGGFRSRPLNSSGTKVFINANKDIGSVQSSDYRYVALRTGSWDGGTTLQVDVGGSGRLFGAGGNGGPGGSASSPGSPGGRGTSALGIEYAGTTVVNRGYIQCGFGGGGGGGGGSSDPDKNQQDAGFSGGGGGGGAGYPAGGGGGAGGGSWGFGNSGGSGSGGTKTVRGGGGGGGFNRNGGGSAGAGGPGGDAAVGGASNGGNCSGANLANGSGGPAGANGAAIINSVGGSYSLSNFSTIVGGTVNDAVL